MSQENVEIVRCAFDAFNRGEVGAALKGAAPSFEYDFSRSRSPGRGIYRLDQMPDYFKDFASTWDSLRLGPDEFLEAGEHVVTPFTNRFRGRDGIEVTARAAFVWTIHDGAIARITFYQERHEALEAVGLSE